MNKLIIAFLTLFIAVSCSHKLPIMPPKALVYHLSQSVEADDPNDTTLQTEFIDEFTDEYGNQLARYKVTAVNYAPCCDSLRLESFYGSNAPTIEMLVETTMTGELRPRSNGEAKNEGAITITVDAAPAMHTHLFLTNSKTKKMHVTTITPHPVITYGNNGASIELIPLTKECTFFYVMCRGFDPHEIVQYKLTSDVLLRSSAMRMDAAGMRALLLDATCPYLNDAKAKVAIIRENNEELLLEFFWSKHRWTADMQEAYFLSRDGLLKFVPAVGYEPTKYNPTKSN